MVMFCLQLDVRTFGRPGGAGEYTNQKGFGWSNGVILILLNTYNDTLTMSPDAAAVNGAIISIVMVLITVCVIVGVVVLCCVCKKGEHVPEDQLLQKYTQNTANKV